MEFIKNFQSEAPLKRGTVSAQDASLHERVIAQVMYIRDYLVCLSTRDRFFVSSLWGENVVRSCKKRKYCFMLTKIVCSTVLPRWSFFLCVKKLLWSFTLSMNTLTRLKNFMQVLLFFQLRAALYDIHDIFFIMEVSERMSILHHDREVRKEKMLRQMVCSKIMCLPSNKPPPPQSNI